MKLSGLLSDWRPPAHGGDKRVQVFDNDGNFKSAFTGVGNATALCITKGASPVLYVSSSNPMDDIDRDGEIYKVRLDGTKRREIIPHSPS